MDDKQRKVEVDQPEEHLLPVDLDAALAEPADPWVAGSEELPGEIDLVGRQVEVVEAIESLPEVDLDAAIVEPSTGAPSASAFK